MKKILISIDTEGDNLWNSTINEIPSTKNLVYLDRFQQLCNKFDFYPTYLCNYEVVSDKQFVEKFKKYQDENKCEIGAHIHAWNNPPDFNLLLDNANKCLPYLFEYPNEISKQKLAQLTKLIEISFLKKPTTFRSGRWGLSSSVINSLKELGYKIDCTITPHRSWKTCLGYTQNSHGNDFSHFKNMPFVFENGLIEIPMQSYVNNSFKFLPIKNLPSRIYHLIKRDNAIWLRPRNNNIEEMIKVVNINLKSNEDYLMFMIHSSELMPNGSNLHETSESIDELYNNLEKLFSLLKQNYIGMTIGQYGELLQKENAIKVKRGYKL